MIFTCFPLGVRAVIDHDLHPKDGEVITLFLPFLYEENKKKPIFKTSSFIVEIFRGMIHGLLNYYLLHIVLLNTPVDSKGNIADMWFFSVNCYTNIIFVRIFFYFIFFKKLIQKIYFFRLFRLI